MKTNFIELIFIELIEENPFKAYAKLVVTESQDKAVQKRVEEKMGGTVFTTENHKEALKQSLLELVESGVI